MVKIVIPATTANIGPGFDVLGIALSMYNTFSIEKSEKLMFIGVQEKYANKHNLIYRSFKKTCQILNKKSECIISYDNINIPFCNGLGSSATLIVAGAMAANKIFGNKLTKNDILKISTEIEGHPDNVSAAIFGGLNVSFYKQKILHKKININKNIKATVIIPDYEVKTEMARKIIKNKIDLSDAVSNISHAILLIDSFVDGDLSNIDIYLDDKIHVPYRKNLIKNYDKIKNICMKNGAKGFTISGSGSTMICFHNENNFSKKINLSNCYKISDVSIDFEGARFVKNM